MFILEMSNNPVYRLTGTLFEIMESLATEFDASQRATDGYESYFEAVWPTDSADVDEDYEYPEPVEINKDSVLEFAKKVWDTHQINLFEDVQPLTAGQFQAMQHHLGLSNAEMAKQLRVDARRLSRWIAAEQPIPVSVTVDMNKLLDQHDKDVEKLLARADSGRTIMYPGNTSEQDTKWAFGWERRVIQRAVIEHKLHVIHASEYVPAVDYFESD